MSQVYVSPSQIATFRDCNRKWAYKYIDRIKLPQKPTQAFGSLGHKRIENYLKTGEHVGDDDVGLVIQQGIKPGVLPLPAPDLLIEDGAKLTIPILDGAAIMIGYIDCIQPPREATPIPISHDWKFTKDLRWAMKPTELEEDAQAGIYTFYVMRRFGVEEVLAKWVYFCGRVNPKTEDGRPRTPRGVRPVELLFNKRMILDNWRTCLATAKEIVNTKRHYAKADDVTPNELSCDAYGGCEFRDRCPLSDDVGLGAMIEQYNKTHRVLTQDLNTDTDPNPQPTEKPEMSTMLDMLRTLALGGGDAPAEQNTTPAGPAAEAETEAPAAESDGMAALAAITGKKKDAPLKGVNPPAEHNTEAPATEAKAEIPAPAAEATKPAATEPETPEEAEAAAAEAAAAEAAAKAAEAKAKAAKAKAEAVKKAKAEAEAKAKAEAEAEAKKTTKSNGNGKGKTKQAAAPSSANGAGGFVLAIDAVPAKVADGGHVIQFADFIAPISEAVASGHRCDEHPKGVPHWTLIEFGHGRGLLAQEVAKALDKDKPDGVMVVDSRSPEADAVKEVLIRRADAIFRGVR